MEGMADESPDPPAGDRELSGVWFEKEGGVFGQLGQSADPDDSEHSSEGPGPGGSGGVELPAPSIDLEQGDHPHGPGADNDGDDFPTRPNPPPRVARTELRSCPTGPDTVAAAPQREGQQDAERDQADGPQVEGHVSLPESTEQRPMPTFASWPGAAPFSGNF